MLKYANFNIQRVGYTLSSRNLPIFKGAYKSHNIEVRNYKFKKKLLLYKEIKWSLNFFIQKLKKIWNIQFLTSIYDF
jgi:hypothetical protein